MAKGGRDMGQEKRRARKNMIDKNGSYSKTMVPHSRFPLPMHHSEYMEKTCLAWDILQMK